MSTIKTDALTSVTTNTDLTLSANGTGGVKVSDYFQLTKGSDISSATSLTLGTDGNAFDVTGTTTITSIATQGIGSHVTLHFDGALTFTHHSTNLILPGATSITTAAGDIAVMYEYASADWRCISYSKASGAAVVAASAGFTYVAEASIASAGTTFSGIPSGTEEIHILYGGISLDTANIVWGVQLGDAGGFETGSYLGGAVSIEIGQTYVGGENNNMLPCGILRAAGHTNNGLAVLTLGSSTTNRWHLNSSGGQNQAFFGGGSKALSAELTQIKVIPQGSDTFDAGTIAIAYR